MVLSSKAKGDIAEDRIKELLLLHGKGFLNVYKPVVDIEGIDLIVNKKNSFKTIFLQVKSRFHLSKSNMVLVDVKIRKPHKNYYVVILYFDTTKAETSKYILLIPSSAIKRRGYRKKLKYPHRVTASLNPDSKCKWSNYLIKKEELAKKLREKFNQM